MNDFTKDEITGIFYMVDTFIRYCDGGQKALVLRDKLKDLMCYRSHLEDDTISYFHCAVCKEDTARDTEVCGICGKYSSEGL